MKDLRLEFQGYTKEELHGILDQLSINNASYQLIEKKGASGTQVVEVLLALCSTPIDPISLLLGYAMASRAVISKIMPDGAKSQKIKSLKEIKEIKEIRIKEVKKSNKASQSANR